MSSMKDLPVSVVIPACNAERFLTEAIESVLAQSYEPVETIVVDDGSDDRTAEIAARYERVKLVRQENRGLPAARNAGVAASSGELLAFNDADDAMLPERLAIQVEHLRANPGVGCVLASQELAMEPDAELPFWAQGTETPLFDRFGDAARSETPDIYTVSMVMSRALFDAVGGFDETMRDANEDVDLLFRLLERGVTIARLPDVVVRRRVHAGSMTQDREASRGAFFELFKRRIDRHRERVS
jgi:glycosyltransferase involved in cell wall biosynthesis